MQFRESVKPFFRRIPDEAADAALVQCAATAMQSKLTAARERGYGGWHGDGCSNASLMEMLARNLAEGDMVDVMNLAAMIHVRRELYDEPVVAVASEGVTVEVALPRYRKLDAHGNQLPDDSRDHAILVDCYAGLMIDVRAIHRGNHASCIAFAGESQLLGCKWRLPTVEEAFLHVADRKRQAPAVNPDLFPKLRSDWIWSSTDDAAPSDPSSPVYAWGVNLSGGYAYLDLRSYDGLALPVSPLAAPASQS